MFSPEKFTLVSDLLWNTLRISQGFDIGKVLQSLHEQKYDNILSTQYPQSTGLIKKSIPTLPKYLEMTSSVLHCDKKHYILYLTLLNERHVIFISSVNCAVRQRKRQGEEEKAVLNYLRRPEGLNMLIVEWKTHCRHEPNYPELVLLVHLKAIDCSPSCLT